MSNNKTWPEIEALLQQVVSVNPPDEDKAIEALQLIAQDPLAQEYYREKLTSEAEDIITVEDFDNAMIKYCPSFQPLFHRKLQQINPPLDFNRDTGIALVTVEIFVRIKIEDKKKTSFIEIPSPVIISSKGQIFECSITELGKHGWTARTIPQQALQRWHPEDVAKFIMETNNGTLKLPNINSIFKEVRSVYTDYVHLEKPVYYDFLAIWDIGTYFHQLFEAFARLGLIAPPDSAKTLVLQLLEYTAFNGMMVVDPTEAVIFRSIEEFSPTLILDEMEGLAKRKNYASGIMTLMRAGYKKIFVARMEENKREGGYRLRLHNCFSPIGVAAIEGMEGVMATRFIRVPLKRRSKEEGKNYKNTDPKLEEARFRQLRNLLYRLLMTRWQELDDLITPTIKKLEGILSNRQLELWTPFLSIAHWIDREREDEGRKLSGGLLEMALEATRERESADREGNQTLMVLQALLQLVKPDDGPKWRNTFEIKDKLDEFFTTPQNWMNDVWVGRLMSQMGITERARKECETDLGKKRLMHYKIDPAWLRDYAMRYGVDLEDWGKSP